LSLLKKLLISKFSLMKRLEGSLDRHNCPPSVCPKRVPFTIFFHTCEVASLIGLTQLRAFENRFYIACIGTTLSVGKYILTADGCLGLIEILIISFRFNSPPFE
jgi:hypothetical protein